MTFLVVLYLFLFLVARAGWRDLRPARSAAPQPTATFTVLDPARSRWHSGARIVVRSGAVVGRDGAGGVMLDEDTVSARHAAIRRHRGRWLIEDLRSTNGTFVNDRPVHGVCAVAAGDQVRFGHVALRFEGEAAPAQPTS